MMGRILKRQPTPKAQVGVPVTFSRRTPEMSRLSAGMTARQLYDFIRMLDAPGYPAAFIQVGDVTIEFRNARMVRSEVFADSFFLKK
jgi:methionyl-tRNA formyltransferase